MEEQGVEECVKSGLRDRKDRGMDCSGGRRRGRRGGGMNETGKM